MGWLNAKNILNCSRCLKLDACVPYVIRERKVHATAGLNMATGKIRPTMLLGRLCLTVNKESPNHSRK